MLPEDVLCSCVLWRLPVVDVARCRCVCRLWKRIIASSRFQTLLKSEEPWLLIACGCTAQCCAYNPYSQRWHTLNIGSPPAWCCPKPISSAGSLLVYMTPQPSLDCLNRDFSSVPPLRLAVCNPFTSTWKELPPNTQQHRVCPFVAGIQVGTGAHFKVVVAGGFYPFHTCLLSTEVYDSLTNSWSFGTAMGAEAAGLLTNHSWFARNGVVCHDGMLYCLIISSRFSSCAIMAFDIECGSWRKDCVYNGEKRVWENLKWRVEGYSEVVSLLKSKRSGRGLVLMAAGGAGLAPRDCVLLSELPREITADDGLLRWCEDMPQPSQLGVGGISRVSQGLASDDTLYLFNRSRLEVVQWDYTTNSWSLLPPYPLHPCNDPEGESFAFLVQPSLLPTVFG